MTYRERREARAQRLREWAEKREQKADSARKRVAAIADHIPLGQPILVGHHSEKHARRDQERIMSGMQQAYEHGQKAREMASKAAEIERQAANAIYSDDPDAAEALTAKIERLEAERDRITAYNASCRKAAKLGKVGDTSLLDEAQQTDLRTLARVAAYQLRPGGAFPPYVSSNLGSNIKRLHNRLEQLNKGPKVPTPATLTACTTEREASSCPATCRSSATKPDGLS